MTSFFMYQMIILFSQSSPLQTPESESKDKKRVGGIDSPPLSSTNQSQPPNGPLNISPIHSHQGKIKNSENNIFFSFSRKSKFRKIFKKKNSKKFYHRIRKNSERKFRDLKI